MTSLAAATALEACLAHTIAYVKERQAFGHGVWDFQNTRFELADIKAQSIAVRTMVDHDLGEHMRRKLTLEEAAIVKLFATETLGSALDTVVQLHGGYGYMLEYPVARAFAAPSPGAPVLRTRSLPGASGPALAILFAARTDASRWQHLAGHHTASPTKPAFHRQ